MEKAWEAEDVVSMKMTDENPHLPIDACLRLQKLALSTFPTIEEQYFRSSAQQHAWKISKLARNATPCSKKGD